MTAARSIASLGLAGFLAGFGFCFAHAPVLTLSIAVADVAIAIGVGKMLKHQVLAVPAAA